MSGFGGVFELNQVYVLGYELYSGLRRFVFHINGVLAVYPAVCQ